MCGFESCGRKIRALGYCERHYQQFKRYGKTTRLPSDTPEHGRFASAIRISPTGCWIWGNSIRGDYGSFRSGGRAIPAHRYAYQQVVGEIPPGLLIDHICRTKACVRPTHLRLASVKQNAENQAGRKGSITGIRGVTVERGQYRAHVMHHGKSYYLGRFQNLNEAAEASKSMRDRLFTHSNGA